MLTTLRIYAFLRLQLNSLLVSIVSKFYCGTCLDLVGHVASGRVSCTSEPSPSPSGDPDGTSHGI